jgi:hypothetical protein
LLITVPGGPVHRADRPTGHGNQQIFARHPHKVRQRGLPVGDVLEHLRADHEVELSVGGPGVAGEVERPEVATGQGPAVLFDDAFGQVATESDHPEAADDLAEEERLVAPGVEDVVGVGVSMRRRRSRRRCLGAGV